MFVDNVISFVVVLMTKVKHQSTIVFSFPFAFRCWKQRSVLAAAQDGRELSSATPRSKGEGGVHRAGSGLSYDILYYNIL